MRKTSPSSGPSNRPPLGSPRSTSLRCSSYSRRPFACEPSDARIYSNPVVGTGGPTLSGSSSLWSALHTLGLLVFEPFGDHAPASMYVDMPRPSGAGVDEPVRHAGRHDQDRN